MGGKLASKPGKDKVAIQVLNKGCSSAPPVPLLAGKRNWAGGENG